MGLIFLGQRSVSTNIPESKWPNRATPLFAQMYTKGMRGLGAKKMVLETDTGVSDARVGCTANLG
jgi:hypothetical protein